MLEGKSILCFAHDWGSDPTSKTHIMRILARKNRVLWVNSIGMRRPTASRRDLGRILAKMRKSLGTYVQVEPNLFVTNPLVLPLPGVPLADSLNAVALAGWLRWVTRKVDLRHPILWSFLPNVTRLVGRLGENMLIYHCVDEYSAFSGMPQDFLIRSERELISRADVVFTSSAQLADERRHLNANTHFVSHGVDVAHFSQALDPRMAVPDDLRPIPRPIIGFFGLLADWVDLSLIHDVARARPDWSVVLVGRPTTGLGTLASLPNVHHLGHKPYASLPGYCRSFDVGIIPFRQNRLTLRANPLKLREYLAAGLPVVATPLPEVARYNGLVRLGDGPGAFVRGIEAALADRSPHAARARVDAMQSESWEARVEEFSRVIEATGRKGEGS